MSLQKKFAIIAGNLVGDVRVFTKEGGSTKLVFRVASEESWGRGESRRVRTDFFNVVYWPSTDAERDFLVARLTKGQPVYTEGSPRGDRFTDKEGIERETFELHAIEVTPLDRPAQSARERPERERAAPRTAKPAGRPAAPPPQSRDPSTTEPPPAADRKMLW